MQTFSVAPEDFQKYTPVMRQYLESRVKLRGKAILLFRMGDFYEAFFEDADLLARELEITLTAKAENNHPGGKIPMAGVPARAVKGYIAKLLEKNYRVYIAEQMADPKTHKGILPREITKVLTPGTVNELDLIDLTNNNFVAALTKSKKATKNDGYFYGLAFADVSTGEFYVTEIAEKFVANEIFRIRANEILLPATEKKLATHIVPELVPDFSYEIIDTIAQNITPFEKEYFKEDLAENNTKKFFELNSTEKLLNENFSNDCPEKLGLRAAGAIIEYIKDTQGGEFDKAIKQFDFIQTYQISEYMILDASARKNLDLVKNSQTGSSNGTVFEALNRCSSILGQRQLKNWISQPLLNIRQITSRQDSLAELLANAELSSKLCDLLKEIYDIKRLINRAVSELINPREACALKSSLKAVLQISVELQNCKSPYLSKLQNLPDEIFAVINEVEKVLVDEPPILITEGGLIKAGFSQQLDEYLTLVQDSKSWLESFEESQKEKLGIKLKVNYNKVHGYFLESSKANAQKIPNDPEEGYYIKQTMVNSVRFITAELKEFEEKITNAESRRNGLEYELFKNLRDFLCDKCAVLKDLAESIANIDVINSFALVSREYNYCRPDLDTELTLEIQNGRHPVVEQKLGANKFIANDFDCPAPIMLLTGPNMSGKSTFMRQNALIVLLAQIGCFVPASSAKIGIVDRIFTRIGASDDLASGQSTFMVEMNEVASILSGMTTKSLLILDEIGRGTSTYDGVAIAWSILEYLAKDIKPRTIFATHYHELAALESLSSTYANYQVSVSESKGQIEFLHKVKPGSADKSYGVEVARLAGLPAAVVTRARSINNQLQANASKKLGYKTKDQTAKAVQDAVSKDGELDVSKLPLFANN